MISSRRNGPVQVRLRSRSCTIVAAEPATALVHDPCAGAPPADGSSRWPIHVPDSWRIASTCS